MKNYCSVYRHTLDIHKCWEQTHESCNHFKIVDCDENLPYANPLKKETFKNAQNSTLSHWSIVKSRHSQSNPVELFFNRTQSNSIGGLSSIDSGNRTKSSSHKKNWTIELYRTFDFRTLDFCKTGVENQ